MKPILALLFVFACCLISGTSGKKFLLQQECKLNNYKLYNVYINTPAQFKIFNNLREKFSVYMMREANENGKLPMHFAVEPQFQKPFELALDKLKFFYEVVHEDLQELVDERNKPASDSVDANVELNWDQYHHLETIERWIFKMADEHDFVKKRVIGYSWWWRPIYALEISKKPGNKAIRMNSNIHSIEWLSSATVTGFIDRMIKSDGKGDALDNLLQNYDWLVVPVQNPDGFEFSHKKCPLWRKTRSFDFAFNETGLCYGVDANRNYNVYWGLAGYNLDNECDHFYAGKKPETEREVRADGRYLKSFPKGYIRMSFHCHTYGQIILRPYGHSNTLLPKNVEQINQISRAFATAATARHGVSYNAGSSGELLGAVSGAAKDWDYERGVPYSVTVELRDRGQYGFMVPGNQIKPTIDEFTDGIIAAVKEGVATGLFN